MADVVCFDPVGVRDGATYDHRAERELQPRAAGRMRHNEIAGAVRTDPTRVLERLVRLGLVDRCRGEIERGWGRASLPCSFGISTSS